MSFLLVLTGFGTAASCSLFFPLRPSIFPHLGSAQALFSTQLVVRLRSCRGQNFTRVRSYRSCSLTVRGAQLLKEFVVCCFRNQCSRLACRCFQLFWYRHSLSQARPTGHSITQDHFCIRRAPVHSFTGVCRGGCLSHGFCSFDFWIWVLDNLVFNCWNGYCCHYFHTRNHHFPPE